MEVEFNLALMSGSLSSLPKLFTRHQNRHTTTLTSPSSQKSEHDSRTGRNNLELSSQQSWTRGIRKKTEITRVFEANQSQERIAPIYGAGELMTTSSAYAEEEGGSISEVEDRDVNGRKRFGDGLS
jgi:hypothetical protein